MSWRTRILPTLGILALGIAAVGLPRSARGAANQAEPAKPTGVAPVASASAGPPSLTAPDKALGNEAAEEEKVAPDSPRQAYIDFRRAAHDRDFGAAAKYLDLSQVGPGEGPTLADHLREVLNRQLLLEADRLSPESHGNVDDDLVPDKELIGTVRGVNGEPSPVFLQRKSYRPGTHWVFSADTVAQIEGWYNHLEGGWLLDHMPAALLRMGPYHMHRWQWLSLFPLLFGGWLVGFTLTKLARLGTQHVLKKNAEPLHALRGPVALLIAVAVWYASLPQLALYQHVEEQVRRWFSATSIVALFWLGWKLVELAAHSLTQSHWARDSISASSFVHLGARFAKVGVFIIATIVVLAELGYHATTIVAGLGIGGVALALAAQKTVENLFGAFSLALDQPFREGDNITVDTVNGTVEAIGLRSTRIRTADRTVVSIPNGKLAEMRVETVNRQDRLRFYTVIGVVHSAAKQLTQILSAVEQLLRAEKLIDKDSVGVHLIAITDSAMNIEIAAMFDTVDGNQFANARQALLLGVVKIIEDAGAALAHPARNLGLSAELKNALSAQPSPPDGKSPESGKRVQTDVAQQSS